MFKACFGAGALVSAVCANLAIAGPPTLYGVTGDGASGSPESLFTINLHDASSTFLATLGNGDDGEAIAVNPNDGCIYHWSGLSDIVFEKVDPVTLQVTDIGLSGGPNDNEEITAATWNPLTSQFLVVDLLDRMMNVATDGSVTGLTPQQGFQGKGVAFLNDTLYEVSRDDAILRTVDPVTGGVLTQTTMTLAGQGIEGATGLAANPETGVLYALLRLPSQFGRDLVTVDAETGVATSIGDTGERFAGIAFSIPEPTGAVMYVGNRQDENMYVVDIDTRTGALLGSSGIDMSFGGLGFGQDGTLYGWETNTNALHTVDTGTGQWTLVGGGAPVGGNSFDVNPLTNEGIVIDLVNDEIWTINLADGSGTFRASADAPLHAGSAYAPDGTLYHLVGAVFNGELFTIDIDTGHVSSIGLTGVTETFTNVSYNPGDGQLYAVEMLHNNLFRIDPVTAQGVNLGPITGLPNSPQYTMSTIRIPPSIPFKKEIVGGPDRDGDGEVDRVVEVRSAETSEYVFKITMNQPDLPPALVRDIVPREWEVMSCVPSNAQDLVAISPLGRLGKSATQIDWIPTDNNSCLECTIQTRPQGALPRPGRPRRNPRFEPNQAGELLVNEGAAALDTTGDQPLMDENGVPLVTPALCLVAVRDQNRDGVIDYTGNGDEDGDLLSDYMEACVLGTDPCNPDTDDDGVPDGTDPEPLDPAVQ